MQKIINFLRGSLRLEVSGPFPERFLNICAANGVGFWGVAWLDAHTLRLTLARRDGRRAVELGERALCQVEVLGRAGVPSFLARFRRRYAFLLGMGISLVAVGLLSQFVLVIEVTGNETVSAQAIREELDRLGFSIGSFGPWVDSRALSNQALLDLEELSYLAVNIQGIRAEVVVRERLAQPEVVDESVPADVVADRTGVVTEIRTLAGRQMVEEGTAVLEGEVLISGLVTFESSDGTGEMAGGYQTRAMGEIWANTWRKTEGVVPLTVLEKDYTGQESTRFALQFADSRINFYRKGGISFPYYDKIRSEKKLTLPGGLVLPLTLVTERYVEYTPRAAAVDPEEARAALEPLLTGRLEASLGEDGQVTASAFTATALPDALQLTLQAQCLEKISKTVELGGQNGT